MSDEVLLGVRVPGELKQLLDADDRTNKEIVQAALWREFGNTEKTTLERKIDELESRIRITENERNERDRELDTLREKREAMQQRLESLESQQQTQNQIREQWFDKLRGIPADEDMAMVHRVADELDMTRQEVVAEMEERFDQ
jgi:septal ring factor EnvC (AmiA/AmiB activator)